MNTLVPAALLAQPLGLGKLLAAVTFHHRNDGLKKSVVLLTSSESPDCTSGESVAREHADTSRRGRIYYPGPAIVVTSIYIETVEATYLVRELSVEDPAYFYAYTARVVALYCGMIEMLLAVAVAALYGSAVPLLCAVGVFAAVGMAVALWVDDLHNPRLMELAAWHKGRRVVLFATRDRRVFEQVRRAVVRSLEANRLHRP